MIEERNRLESVQQDLDNKMNYISKKAKTPTRTKKSDGHKKNSKS